MFASEEHVCSVALLFIALGWKSWEEELGVDSEGTCEEEEGVLADSGGGGEEISLAEGRVEEEKVVAEEEISR